MKRREFINHGLQFGIMTSLFGCNFNQRKENERLASNVALPIKLSLAQWSVHRMIRDGGMNPFKFPAIANKLGFSGLEYVSNLYKSEFDTTNFSKEEMKVFVENSNSESQKYGLKNLVIMVNKQGDLASSDPEERNRAVDNHYKWVDAAKAMKCHSIRVNLRGNKNQIIWLENSVKGLAELAKYSKNYGINILVENHGGFSSNAALLVKVIESVNMENCGTLPDFGNFCIEKTNNSMCIEQYDKYQGVREMMPFAKGVSAKSHDFDSNGNETRTDYKSMLQILKDFHYKGYIGVEYEGKEISEKEGILATKKLLINTWSKLK